MYIYNFLIYSSAYGHLGCSHALAIVNSAAMSMGYMCLFQFWFPWCVCIAVGLLGCMAVLFPVLDGVMRGVGGGFRIVGHMYTDG